MTAIRTLLVANRGEIARRVFRTARAMGMRGAAVFADADESAPFVAEADMAVRLPGGYLDGDAVVAAASAVGADAVHPGYGFLAENADFARAVTAAGLVWVGPSPDAIETMGDKLAAKAAAEAAGVPVLPSSEDPADARGVGFPLMVKAAAGGGGKGMRLVSKPPELEAAVAAARREALGGFGDDTVFLERYLPRCRHVEIQILGDAHGSVVHLGERECSIQRRHQKIIEESPSAAVDEDLRASMGDAAVRLASSIGYRSAGTVELLLDDETGEFYFLEVNTRLQVEHPVTEEVTGIDLVREQLRIAAGEPLGYSQADIAFSGHAIEARLYAEDPAAGFLPATGTLAAFEPPAQPLVRWDSGVEAGGRIGLDFDPMLAKVIAHAPTRAEAAGRLALALEGLHIGGVTTNRHFLAASLRSEAFLAGDTTTDFIERVDPSRAVALSARQARDEAIAAALWLQARERRSARTLGWMPSGWRLGRLPAERVELAVSAGGEPVSVTVRYRPRRDGAFDVEARTGADSADDDALARGGGPSAGEDAQAHGGLSAGGNAQARGGGLSAGEDAQAHGGLSAGGNAQARGGAQTGGRGDIGDGGARAVQARVVHWSETSLDLECDGRRVRRLVTLDGDRLYLTGAGETVTATVIPRFAVADRDAASGGFAAPMPGSIVEVRVAPGDAVSAGQTLVVMEGMKMEHHVSAPCNGTVTEVLVARGDQVENGSPLLVFEAADAATDAQAAGTEAATDAQAAGTEAATDGATVVDAVVADARKAADG